MLLEGLIGVLSLFSVVITKTDTKESRPTQPTIGKKFKFLESFASFVTKQPCTSFACLNFCLFVCLICVTVVTAGNTWPQASAWVQH